MCGGGGGVVRMGVRVHMDVCIEVHRASSGPGDILAAVYLEAWACFVLTEL